MSLERIVDAKEAMERLKVSKPTLYGMIRRGTIRPLEDPIDKALTRRKRLLFAESEVQRVERGEPITDRVA